MKIKVKRLLIEMLVGFLIFAVLTTVYSWFTNQRKLATVTRVNAPSALVIGAGAKESSTNIDIGSINVEEELGKKDFVFSVYSDNSVSRYKLQLAHTTNIDFSYTIYKATESMSYSGNESVEYIDALGNTRYYTKDGSALAGSYLNLNGQIANNSLHDKSYKGYGEVQKNAEPLYWQTANNIQPTNNNLSGFLDYYILEISWGENVSNDKETDIVYLTAGIV